VGADTEMQDLPPPGIRLDNSHQQPFQRRQRHEKADYERDQTGVNLPLKRFSFWRQIAHKGADL